MIFNNLKDEHGAKTSVVSDVRLATQMGLVNGQYSYNKFGMNGTVGTTYETVWTGQGIIPWLDVAATMKISSESADDVMTSGSGAWKVWLQGLNGSFVETSEIVELNGLTAVETDNQYLCVYRMKVISADDPSTGAADHIWCGTGALTDGVPAVKYAHIAHTGTHSEGQTLQCFYQVPVGYTAYITSLHAATPKGDDIELELYVQTFDATANGSYQPWQVKKILHIYQGSSLNELLVPIKVLEKSRIDLRAESSQSSSSVTADWDMLLIKD